jgi:hypothetical protein
VVAGILANMTSPTRIFSGDPHGRGISNLSLSLDLKKALQNYGETEIVTIQYI